MTTRRMPPIAPATAPANTTLREPRSVKPPDPVVARANACIAKRPPPPSKTAPVAAPSKRAVANRRTTGIAMVALGSPPPTHDCQDEQGRAWEAGCRTDPQEQKADRRRDHAPAQSCCEHAA